MQSFAGFVIASEAKQSMHSFCCAMDCFASLAMTGDQGDASVPEHRR
jgi:hypothetical protein